MRPRFSVREVMVLAMTLAASSSMLGCGRSIVSALKTSGKLSTAVPGEWHIVEGDTIAIELPELVSEVPVDEIGQMAFRTVQIAGEYSAALWPISEGWNWQAFAITSTRRGWVRIVLLDVKAQVPRVVAVLPLKDGVAAVVVAERIRLDLDSDGVRLVDLEICSVRGCRIVAMDRLRDCDLVLGAEGLDSAWTSRDERVVQAKKGSSCVLAVRSWNGCGSNELAWRRYERDSPTTYITGVAPELLSPSIGSWAGTTWAIIGQFEEK